MLGKNLHLATKSKLQRATCDQKRKSPPIKACSSLAIFIGKEVKKFTASLLVKQKPSTSQGYKYSAFGVSSAKVPECKGYIESIFFFFFFFFFFSSGGMWVGKAMTMDSEGKFIGSKVVAALLFFLDRALELPDRACPHAEGIVILRECNNSNNSKGVIAP